jgi:hypothetical protein
MFAKSPRHPNPVDRHLPSPSTSMRYLKVAVLLLPPHRYQRHLIVSAVVGNPLCSTDTFRVAIHLRQNRPRVEFAQPSLVGVFLAMASKPSGECYVSQSHWFLQLGGIRLPNVLLSRAGH